MRGWFFVILLFFLLFPKQVFSQDYILPYPSFMPGSKFYSLHQGWEKIAKYWYFGDFGSIKYNLHFSDKYLVEAKTLFEYDQYLLGVQALEKSDKFFSELPDNLQAARSRGKNVKEQKIMVDSASIVHIEVLHGLTQTVPERITWRPEKEEASELSLHELLNNSVLIRQQL